MQRTHRIPDAAELDWAAVPLGQRVSSEFVENDEALRASRNHGLISLRLHKFQLFGLISYELIVKSTDSCSKAIEISAKRGSRATPRASYPAIGSQLDIGGPRRRSEAGLRTRRIASPAERHSAPL
jgi:hypothetical protein